MSFSRPPRNGGLCAPHKPCAVIRLGQCALCPQIHQPHVGAVGQDSILGGVAPEGLLGLQRPKLDLPTSHSVHDSPDCVVRLHRLHKLVRVKVRHPVRHAFVAIQAVRLHHLLRFKVPAPHLVKEHNLEGARVQLGLETVNQPSHEGRTACIPGLAG